MTAKRRKKARRDNIGAGGQYYLWPDENGLIRLPQSSPEPLKESRSLRLPLSPRGEKARALQLLRSRSLSLYLLSKSWGVVGFGAVRKRIFGQWLSQVLESCDFGALEIGAVVRSAVADLNISDEEARRLLAQATSEQGEFKSDGWIVTAK